MESQGLTARDGSFMRLKRCQAMAHLPSRAQQTSEWSLESGYHGEGTHSCLSLIPSEKLSYVLADPRRCGSALRCGHCNGHMARTGLFFANKAIGGCQGHFSGLDNEIAMRVAFGESSVTESLGVG